MVGRTLAHFEVLEILGEGGMGVVYKARDLRLQRLVALKLLPPQLVADPERRRRFVQEARTASALNHPNITSIYEIDSVDGVDYIAMEYVAGKTLGDLLHQNLRSEPMASREIVQYAVQIAAALTKAHGAGIVHRDLKPANIMIGPDGLVKILDFGLAKLIEPKVLDSSSPTETHAPHTRAGTILGTASYMSPEQAEGKPVDERSDIFSFGAVLYEMMTGRRAFEKDNVISTLSAVLKDDPRQIHEIAPNASSSLETIVMRCLRKDPSRRFQHADDLRVNLEEVLDELRDTARSSAARRPITPRMRIPWAIAAPAMLAAVALIVWFAAATKPASNSDLRSVPITSDAGSEDSATFSPDGNQVAYSWDGAKQENFDIYVKLVGLGNPLRLTSDPAPDLFPSWSPDGRFIAFLRDLPDQRAALMVVPALGGPERKLADGYQVKLPYGNPTPAWSPDSHWLIVADKSSPQDPSKLTLVSATSGEKRQLTSPPVKSLGDSDASFSFDGQWVAFVRTASFLTGDLYALALSGTVEPKGEPVRLTSESRVTGRPAWIPESHELVFPSGSPAGVYLWRMPLNRSMPPRRVIYAGDDAYSPSIARQGRRLAYTRGVFDPNVWQVIVENPGAPAGPPTPVLSSTRIDSDPAYSPDGKKIAFESTRSGNYEIWVSDRDGSNVVQVTSFKGPGVGIPRWSPDSARLAFDSNANGQYDVYSISVNGGQATRLTDHSADDQVPSWSSDGRWIYFASRRGGDFQIWKIPADGGDATQVTTAGGYAPSESADGKFLYYTKRSGLWRTPTTSASEARVIDTVINNRAYAVTDQGIYFISAGAAETLPGISPKSSIQFFRFSTGAITTIAPIPKPLFAGFSASSDGRFILYAQVDQDDSDLMLVDNFR